MINRRSLSNWPPCQLRIRVLAGRWRPGLESMRPEHRQLRTAALFVYGSAVPDFAFTREMSALLRKPSTFTSSRKFDNPTEFPDWALV